jgi:hypothetical protein
MHGDRGQSGGVEDLHPLSDADSNGDGVPGDLDGAQGAPTSGFYHHDV